MNLKIPKKLRVPGALKEVEEKGLESLNEIKVFSFEESARLISVRLEEVDQTISEFKKDIPGIVVNTLREIKAEERELRNRQIAYWGKILIAGGFLNSILRLLEWAFL